MPALRIIGAGRAGMSLAGALAGCGWQVEPLLGRHDPVQNAATGVDLLVIATPDDTVASVAASVEPVASTVVAHLAGSLGLDVLAAHPRRASIHPLVPLPDPITGAARLAGRGASAPWFAVAGDPLAAEVVAALGGRPLTLADADRAAYHAAAVAASNHEVALLAHAARIAPPGVPLEALVELSRASLDDVARLGPTAALTGPAARGDTGTVRRHLAALDPAERPVYRALAGAAARLGSAGRRPVSAAPGGGGTAAGTAAGSRARPLLLERAADLRPELDGARAAGLTVGLVPTMGALHEAHLSLIRRSAAERDVTVVTVFVNPLQFGEGEDFRSYPRDLERDLALAGAAGADVVLAPSADDMFGASASTTVVVAGLTETLEGASRPGHFTGVATIVTKLLDLAAPCCAYFGEKDWQQLLVVRRLVGDLSIPVEVVACPTVREPDGLAMSSRNARLSVDERRAATVLHRALGAGAALIGDGEADSTAVGARMAAVVALEPLVRLDYAVATLADDLGVPDGLSGAVRLLVAASVGATRLIDNLGVQVPTSSRSGDTQGHGATLSVTRTGRERREPTFIITAATTGKEA